MKKNGIFSKKSFLTIASVLSMLLAFSAVCGVVLFILYQVGVFKIPSAENGGTIDNAGAAVSLPLYTGETKNADELLVGLGSYEKLITETPFYDSFYLKVGVVCAVDSGYPASGTYELWRYGEKFRINHYDENDEVQRIITCDGTNVQIIDFELEDVFYYPVSEEYSFLSLAPLPDFKELMKAPYEFFEYTEADGVITAVCEYLGRSMIDETQLTMSTGFLKSYRCMINGEYVFTLETISTDLTFIFQDYMFEFD